jgi:hypothetical protein
MVSNVHVCSYAARADLGRRIGMVPVAENLWLVTHLLPQS